MLAKAKKNERTDSNVSQPRAVALISGGLDSMLAAKMMLEQGIHVEGLNFFTGFCVEGHTQGIRKNANKQKRPKRNNALWVAKQLGIKLHIIDVVERYKQVVINPKHGYGSHLNPCLDCKVFMVKEAIQWLKEHDFDFIVSGEVIGQRPKSQLKRYMPIVAHESGAEDRLLRPLSALNLPPTLAERTGWVKRSLLGAISGRSRATQMALAKDYDIKDYAQPAGGCCFLTNKHYSNKLKDLWQNRGSKEYALDDIMLLKVGRHVRPNANFKLIIGREEGENRYLEGYRKDFIHLRTLSHAGPLVLLDGKPDADDIHLAARITARYSQGRDANQVIIQVHRHQDLPVWEMAVKPLTSSELPQEWLL